MRQVLGFHIFHSFLFSAFLFNSAYDDSYRNSFSIPNHFLPLGLLPIIRPSITFLSRLSPLSIRPIQLFFLLQITSIRLLSSCSICSTSSFVFMSLQLIFFISLHTHLKSLQSSDIFFVMHVCPCFSCLPQLRIIINEAIVVNLGFVDVIQQNRLLIVTQFSSNSHSEVQATETV